MKKRYIVGLCLLGLAFLTADKGYFLNIGPVRPYIQLPGEAYPEIASDFMFGAGVLNTFLASLLVYAILFALPLIFRPASRPAEQVPSSRGYNFLEMITETGYNFVEGIVGSQNVKAFFPYFMTFFMLVLTANLTSMIPGFDSIGFWENKPHFYELKAMKEAKLEGEAQFNELKELAGGDLVKFQTLVAEKVTHPAFKDAALHATGEDQLKQLLNNSTLASYLDEEYLNIALGFAEPHGEEGNHEEEASTEEHPADESHDEEATTEEPATDESHEVDLAHPSVDVTTADFFDTLAHEYKLQVDAKNVGDFANEIVPGVFGILQNAYPDENDKKPDNADYTIVPFLRPAASDLTFTLALSLMTMIMVQIVGFRYLGPRYLVKFFNFGGMLGAVDTMANNPIQGMISGLIDPAVGLIELISEFAKIISFAFRLLGAVFGGMVLLFVMANLAPIANIAFFGLEMFVGSIQALVFAMLSVIFINGATHAHGGHDEHHDDGHAHH